MALAALTGAIDRSRSPCAACAMRQTNICKVLLDVKAGPVGASPLRQSHETARARHHICHPGEAFDHLIVICTGWALRAVHRRDGRRHILSFLLPGDVVSASSLFGERASFAVQAVTDLHFCRFDRGEIRRLLSDQPQVLDAWAKTWLAELDWSDQFAVNLGRRQADERIACLILLIMARLAARNMVHDGTFVFPLRQQHVADATGLTAVHVSRVIGAFRRAGLVALQGGWLKILDMNELRRLGEA